MGTSASHEHHDELALEIYERIRPSLVDVHVKHASDGSELHTLGVTAEAGRVTAWSGVVAAAGQWTNLETIPVCQGTQQWRAELNTLQADWALCGLAVRGDFSPALMPWRRSNTLALGDRLLYAVAGEGEERPRLGWIELVDVYTPRRDYVRPRIWTARLDPGMPRAYAFAFDVEGRVAGILEPFPDLPSLGALLPGECVGALAQRCWVEMLMKTGSLQQLVDEYKEEPDSYCAEAQCAIGAAFFSLGDREGSRQAWTRAIPKDPLNPWPRRALGSLLATEGRYDEAELFLGHALRLEAQEPGVEPATDAATGSMIVDACNSERS